MKLLSLNNPIIFNLIFGQNPEMMQSLLNSVLQLEKEDKIENLQILDIMNYPQTRLEKEIYEITAEDNEGRLFCITVNTLPERLFLKRPIYSTKGKDTGKMKTFSLHFLNYNIFNNYNYILNYTICESESSFKKMEEFHIYTIELPKFNLRFEELRTFQDSWIYLLKNSSSLTTDQIEHLKETDIQLKTAIKALESASADWQNWTH